MNYVGRQLTKLAMANFKLEMLRESLTTMDVNDIAMKTTIANIFSTVQVLKIMVFNIA